MPNTREPDDVLRQTDRGAWSRSRRAARPTPPDGYATLNAPGEIVSLRDATEAGISFPATVEERRALRAQFCDALRDAARPGSRGMDCRVVWRMGRGIGDPLVSLVYNDRIIAGAFEYRTHALPGANVIACRAFFNLARPVEVAFKTRGRLALGPSVLIDGGIARFVDAEYINRVYRIAF